MKLLSLKAIRANSFRILSAEKLERTGKSAEAGISSEYVCICTSIHRKVETYAATVNRAKPDAAELTILFSEHIAQGTLILCDDLKSYRRLAVAAGCTVKDCHNLTEEEKSFFNLNTVNGLHSFIKHRYDFYRRQPQNA